MTDERPGEREGFRGTKVTDEPPSDEDTEGHRRLFKAGEGTDEPPSDETEGHGLKAGKLTPDADESAQPGEQKIARRTVISDESDTEG